MIDYDIRHGRTYLYLKQKPLYAFGFGLSYTSFAYTNLRINRPTMSTTGSVQVSFEVKNTGSRDGDEVAQMYISHKGSSVERPLEELKGFERIHLKSGESRTISLPLAAKALAYWQDSTNFFTVEPDTVEVSVGPSSDRLTVHTMIHVVQ
jgi:beta-glucosidase